jgi:tRNA (adenine37-N6)-methyltransferase
MGLLSWIRSIWPTRNVLGTEPVTYRPIGIVRNPVREARLHGWEEVRSDIILREDLTDALDDLDGFSHVIVVFHLDRIPEEERRPLKVPLAGEGEQPSVGPLATRMPLRPNPIGVSVARVVRRRKNVLRVTGLDALNGSPVLDLKPYLPPFDAVSDASIPAWARLPDA